MRNYFLILFVVFSNLFFSQNNFRIELKAPEFIKDSLSITPPVSGGNTYKIYDYEVITNKNISLEFNTIKVKILPEIIIEGKISYPQPLVISYYDPKINGGFETKPIFIEKGNYKLTVNKNHNLDYILDDLSPSNKEYKILKERLKIFDDKLKPFQDNDPKTIGNKEKFLQSYIKENPNSYVAFWEIVNDFSRFSFNKSYIKSLDLFSDKLKKTFSYKEFKKIIDIENSTNVGGNFPNVTFGDGTSILKSNFSQSDLTLIDYWSTTCNPCIEDLPKLVALYEKYKGKNVDFISVTDESDKERIDLATTILEKNKVSWKNHFDMTKEFPKKLNAAGYPLQILVDRNGKIVARKMGELDLIDIEISNYIK